LWPFFVVLIRPFYRDFTWDWYKTWDFGAEISWKPAGKKPFNCYPFRSIKNTADVDNLCKFLLDCLNGVLYNDDGQVIRLVAEKSFGDDRGGNGYTIVSISACSE
jgi:Holliday junction resolvase RusA-like endonuclease